MRKRNPLTVKDVAAGATDAYIQLPTGLTYDVILVKLTNCTPAQFKNVRVQAGTDHPQRFRDGADLTDINKHFGRRTNTASGYLHFYFLRPEMKDYIERRMTCFGTSDINQARILFDIDAAAAGATVEAWAVRSPAQPSGLMTRITPFKETFAAAGDMSMKDIHKAVRGRVAAVHLKKSDITAAKLELDTVPIWDLPRTEAVELSNTMDRDPQANWTVLDFIEEGDANSAAPLQGVQESDLTVTIGTSGVVEGYFETFAGLIRTQNAA